MNHELFLSILAMDSYNRGYGQNIDGLPNTGSIGSATIIAQSNVNSGSAAVSAGFYAIAYEWDGQTVISYRGTNDESVLKIAAQKTGGKVAPSAGR